MNLQKVVDRGLVLLGCGKMGSAMLKGWLAQGVPVTSVWVQDPAPSEWVQSLGLHLNETIPDNPAVIVIAVKPQMMGAALPAITGAAGADTVVLSIAAGTPISAFEAAFGPGQPIVRSMPNTPAAVGKGITAIIGNAAISSAQLELAEALLHAIGQTVRLEDEPQMDAVTAVSGSGPAYVFHLIECMAAAGEAEGLSPEMALKLARATVAGAGTLAENSAEDPGQLRTNVTSPGGTTAAALSHLMDPETGFPGLVGRAVAAATNRSRELSK